VDFLPKDVRLRQYEGKDVSSLFPSPVFAAQPAPGHFHDIGSDIVMSFKMCKVVWITKRLIWWYSTRLVLLRANVP